MSNRLTTYQNYKIPKPLEEDVSINNKREVEKTLRDPDTDPHLCAQISVSCSGISCYECLFSRNTMEACLDAILDGVVDVLDYIDEE